MKIIVELVIKDGCATITVDSEERREGATSMGGSGSEFTDETFDWACALAGVQVKGLLQIHNPHNMPKSKIAPSTEAQNENK